MHVSGVDERMLAMDRPGTNYVVFIFEGDHSPDSSWSVDSYLVTDGELVDVLDWLGQHLPKGACYALGVVIAPADPTTDSQLDVLWVLGADVLNMDPHDWTSTERRRAEAMLARRNSVRLT
jgi:hypothetical protein